MFPFLEEVGYKLKANFRVNITSRSQRIKVSILFTASVGNILGVLYVAIVSLCSIPFFLLPK